MKSIAIFDFDGTLYTKDSFVEICKFIYRRSPHRIVFVPLQFFGFLLFKLRLLTAKQFKVLFCIYLYGMTPSRLCNLLVLFWENEPSESFNNEVLNKAKELSAENTECVCVSASPELFLRPVIKHLGFQLIGTKLEYNKGFYLIIGKNCRAKEKINRIFQLYPQNTTHIRYAISDNHDDIELLSLATESQYLKKDKH